LVVVLVLFVSQMLVPSVAAADVDRGLSLNLSALDKLPGAETRQAASPSALYYAETGFGVEEPHFVEYFSRRGGVGTFGFPISRTIRFQGLPTQFFQRIVIQLWPDGRVQPLNLLDPGLLPYTHINGSTFPAPNERLAALAPAPDQPGYGAEVLQFVRRNAPDTFEGQPVRFFSTFNSTVPPEVAFGRAGGDPSLLPLINLEIWGVPTSLPARDPNNGNFIYQRFQRGIMHYDASCQCTQGLLLADYFKSLLTGENLPVDLDAQAASSPFLRQYAPDRPTSLRQPTTLPGTDLTSAFTKQAEQAMASRLPSVSASSVSVNLPPSGTFRTRIRLGDGLGTPIDVMETFGLVAPLQTLVETDTNVSFGPLNDATHARYVRIGDNGAGAIRSIIVNTRWQQADPKAVATLLVHESKHLEDDVAGVDPRTPDACYDFEVRAFTQQAVAWQAFYGPNGKVEPADDLDVELNAWVSVYRRGPGEIEKRVRQLYAGPCSRPGPRPH